MAVSKVVAFTPKGKSKSKGSTRGVLNLNKSYNFTEKAEMIDALRTAYDDAGITITFAANKTGVCKSTFRAWFGGKTMKPQYPTLNAAGKIVGLRLEWVKIK